MEINGTICLYAVKQAWVAELRAETRLGGSQNRSGPPELLAGLTQTVITLALLTRPRTPGDSHVGAGKTPRAPMYFAQCKSQPVGSM